MTERFIIWEHADKSWLLMNQLESDSNVSVAPSREILFQGARLMVSLGFDPQTKLTTRWRSKAFDNFVPMPIEYLAQLTISESDKGGTRIEPFRESRRFAHD